MTRVQDASAAVEALCGDLSSIRAPRGTGLNARGWQTEAPLRMLLNNLDPEVAEHPERLVDDRSLSADIERVADAVRSGAVQGAAEREIGALA